MTTTDAEAMSLLSSGSAVAVVTATLLVTRPVSPNRRSSVTVALAPLASVPIVQMACRELSVSQLPFVVAASRIRAL